MINYTFYKMGTHHNTTVQHTDLENARKSAATLLGTEKVLYLPQLPNLGNLFEAKESGGFWYVYQCGETIGTWVVGHMPNTKEECEDAAERLNAGATIQELPHYGERYNPNQIVAWAPWGDWYTAEDAENGCVPSEAYYQEELEYY